MKKTLLTCSLIVFSACGGGASTIARNGISGGETAETSTDCSGFQSDMLVPYGIDTPAGTAMAGKKFAKLVAVDSLDGKMKITIVPPDGSPTFSTALLDEITEKGYTIRVIACRENPSSVVNGYTTTGVCSSSGPINLIGSTTVTSAEFPSDGFTVNSIKVHATSTGLSRLKPNFIMITAGGLVEQNQVGDFMIAFGRSPYFKGCYSR